ncbi:MAG: lipoyl(octanoyl) transferase LipB, partial [Pseudomonadota bacterium]
MTIAANPVSGSLQGGPPPLGSPLASRCSRIVAGDGASDAREAHNALAWWVSDAPVSYDVAVDWMNAAAAQIAQGARPETIWFLEHPSIYTGGTSAKPADLKSGPDGQPLFPAITTGRGGQWTYHGPGQRVVYVMLDLRRRDRDVRAFVTALERWVIAALATFNVAGEARADRVGIWVKRPETGLVGTGGLGAPACEDKIAAIGVRVRNWVTMHGLAINVAPDLTHFDGIVPCGIAEHGVTSLEALGQ